MRSDLFQTTSKIAAYARSGRISHARKLFDEMLHKDSIAWNAMLTGYTQLGLHQEALSLFSNMRVSHSKPDNFSFSAMLNACAGACDLRFGTKIHALVMVSGCQPVLPVSNSLIDMYGKCFNPSDARKVFDEMTGWNEVTWCSLLFAYVNATQFGTASELFHSMPKKVEIAWNIMIVGHARCGKVETCLQMLKEMCQSLYQPDQWTFSALMNACSESSQILYGQMVHGFVIKSGWSSSVEVKNSTLSLYSKLGCHIDALKVFDSLGTFNQVSWNAIIDVHMKMGDTQEAFCAFQQAPERNIISWTSMIAGYARNGNGELALSMFVDMKRNSIQLDDLVAGAVLHACASLALIHHGKMVHNFIIRYGLQNYIYVSNSLINMYAKCGELEGSRIIFHSILEKDLISWNTMLFAFGLHGRGDEALCMYEEMVKSGVKPDEVTFIGMLITCSHLGLIDEGLRLFDSMRSQCGLSHGMDHIACVVDMLSRGGYVEEARKLANKYSMTGRAMSNSCEILLGACHAHGDLEMGASVGADLKNLQPYKEVSYVLLSNLYCTSGKWKEAEMVRKAMMDQGVKKVPGSSWIELPNEVATFVSGNSSHPRMAGICKILYFLEFEMRNPCHINFDNRRVLNSPEKHMINDS